MKKYLLLSIYLGLAWVAAAQTETAVIFDCFRKQVSSHSITVGWKQEFEKLKEGIRINVNDLIQREQVVQRNGVPYYVNLASVVRTAMELSVLDSLYDDFFIRAATSIQQQLLPTSTCAISLSPAEQRDLLTDFLEDELFVVETNFASQFFAQQVGFRSALQQINQQTDQWLAAGDTELRGQDLQTTQPLTEDHYWRVLNTNWDIELRQPEPVLQEAVQRLVAQAGKEKNSKLKDVLLFIFDNWKDIKDILEWLQTAVFYDCSPVATTSFRDLIAVDPSLLTGARRKISYHFLQRGVSWDGRATKTHLKGIARVYRKKWMGWGRDRLNRVGISYCTSQWNACENNLWPSDGSTFVQAPNHQAFKNKLSHFYPYAFTIKNSNNNFLTFDLHVNEQYFKSVYLFGNRPCYGN